MVTDDAATRGAASRLVMALVEQREAMLAYVARYLPPPLRGSVDPADVVQDVCFEALRREAAFRPDIDPTGRRWLFTLAHRRLIRLMERHYASRQTTVAALAAGDDDSLTDMLGELAVYERTPSQSAASHETWAAVHAAFGRLHPDYASVLRSRFFDRLAAAEVAAATGRSTDAVHKLAQRAMAALRSELRTMIAHG